jgi:predicted PurR-regulated permease PerM
VFWLVNHRIPRWAAVVAVVLVTLGVAGGFLTVAIPDSSSNNTSNDSSVARVAARTS